MTADGTPTVMLVDDDPQVRSLYAEYLDPDYHVVGVSGGREALDRLDGSIDVVLLDRRMPGLSGAEVLHRVRERGADCAVALVTAIEPDLDVIDLGFDDYLVKPVPGERLTALVERLPRWLEYDAQLREYYCLASKAALLEGEAGPTEPPGASDDEDRHDRLEAVQAAARQALDQAVAVGELESVLHRTVVAD